MKTTSIKIEYVPINDLKFATYNPRKATDKEFADLKANIEKFGFVDPILVNSFKDRYNTIIGGHFRVRVAKALGFGPVPVVYVEIADEKEEMELNVRLNKNTGTFDYDILANLFDENDLADWGFTAMDIPTLDNTGGSGTSGSTPDGDGLKTLSFKVTKEQAERIEEVLGHVQNGDLFKFTETFGNTNKDGNALYALANNFNTNIG